MVSVPKSEWRWFGTCPTPTSATCSPSHDWMMKFGYEDIGVGRKYETMVFRAGKPCDKPDCLVPHVTEWGELDFDGYNDAKAATEGHLALCEKWSAM